MTDYTWQGIPNMTPPTDTSGNGTCPGGVCGGGGGSSGGGYSDTYPAGERYGGQKTLGDVYRENQLKCQQMAEAMRLKQDMLNQFGGPESTWIRLMIQKAPLSAFGYTYGTREGGRFEPPPLPDWMEPYILPQQEQGRGDRTRGGKDWRDERTPFKETPKFLRPLGAQAELTPEQQQWMSGWLSWQAAGAPTKYSEEALMRMSDIERSWTPYTMESQALFPKQQRLRPKWATARQ